MKKALILLLTFSLAGIINVSCNKKTVVVNQNTAAKRKENRKKRKGHHSNNNYFGKSNKDKYKQP